MLKKVVAYRFTPLAYTDPAVLVLLNIWTMMHRELPVITLSLSKAL
jgi:hypothetical protein